MSQTKPINAYEANSPEELEALWQRWSSGRMERYVAHLLAFAESQRQTIASEAANQPDSRALLRAAKRMVIEMGTVHYPTEMQDQMREIHDYIWYHGERGEYDRDRITHDWATRHAANWRSWRMKEYLFVIDRISDELVARIRNPSTD